MVHKFSSENMIVRKPALDKADLQSAKHIELKNASHADIQFKLLLPDELVEENWGVYPRCVFNERWEIGTSGYVFEPDILRACPQQHTRRDIGGPSQISICLHRVHAARFRAPRAM